MEIPGRAGNDGLGAGYDGAAIVLHDFRGFGEISHFTVESADERRVDLLEDREHLVADAVTLVI